MLALTNEGDTVLDPFAGVGSSLVAALKNERAALGCDKVSGYVAAGLERIAQLKAGTLITRPIYREIYDPVKK